MPDGKILNAQIKINDSILMLSDEFPGSGVKSPSTLGSSTVTIHVYTKDVDKLWQRAISAGAKTIMPLGNQFWGERYGQLSDPFGHRWSISSRIAMSPEESESKRKAAMVLFSRGNTPESRARPEGQPTQKPPRNKTQPDQRDSESTLSCRNQCSGSLHNANF